MLDSSREPPADLSSVNENAPESTFMNGQKSMSSLYLQRVPTFDAAPEAQALSEVASASDLRTAPTLSIYSLLESGGLGSGRALAVAGQKQQQSTATAAVSTRGRHRKLALFAPRMQSGSGSGTGTPRRPESDTDGVVLSSGIVTSARTEQKSENDSGNDTRSSEERIKDDKREDSAPVALQPNTKDGSEQKAQLEDQVSVKQEQRQKVLQRTKMTAEQLSKEKHQKKDAELRKILNKIRSNKDDRAEGWNAKNQFEKVLHKVEQPQLKAYELVDIKSKAKIRVLNYNL